MLEKASVKAKKVELGKVALISENMAFVAEICKNCPHGKDMVSRILYQELKEKKAEITNDSDVHTSSNPELRLVDRLINWVNNGQKMKMEKEIKNTTKKQNKISSIIEKNVASDKGKIQLDLHQQFLNKKIEFFRNYLELMMLHQERTFKVLYSQYYRPICNHCERQTNLRVAIISNGTPEKTHEVSILEGDNALVIKRKLCLSRDCEVKKANTDEIINDTIDLSEVLCENDEIIILDNRRLKLDS